nr:hypothetical protein [Tanacetum cinerariifolium]
MPKEKICRNTAMTPLDLKRFSAIRDFDADKANKRINEECVTMKTSEFMHNLMKSTSAEKIDKSYEFLDSDYEEEDKLPKNRKKKLSKECDDDHKPDDKKKMKMGKKKKAEINEKKEQGNTTTTSPKSKKQTKP